MGAYANLSRIDEDCLSLNVWAPANAANLPVFVYIHGGGYVVGCTEVPRYDGRFIAGATPTVVVTFNYRLGALGFLAGGPLKGNYGIMDQQAVLAWVQKNIANFGGDPTKVTLVGQSAGAISVATHLVLPSSSVNQNFHSAIVQSDPILMRYRSMKEQKPLYDAFALTVGCYLSISPVDCLKQLQWQTILKWQNFAAAPLIFNNTWQNVMKKLPYSPTLDPDYLPMDPWMALQFGIFYKVPVIIGTVANETAGFVDILLGGSNPNTPIIAAGVYDWGFNTLFGKPLADMVRARYPPIPTAVEAISRAVTDMTFTCATSQAATWLSQYVPTFVYVMTHSPRCDPNNWMRKMCDGRVCHAADIDYTFHSTSIDRRGGCTWGDAESQLSWEMVYRYTNFTASPRQFNMMPLWSTSTTTNVNFDIPIYTSTNLNSRLHCDFWSQMYSGQFN